jgi:hypothetical protein
MVSSSCSQIPSSISIASASSTEAYSTTVFHSLQPGSPDAVHIYDVRCLGCTAAAQSTLHVLNVGVI